MKLTVLTLLTLTCLSPSLPAQVKYIPATPVAETLFPLFKDSIQAAPLANFRLHLTYESTSKATLQITPKTEITLPPGSHTLDLTHEHFDTREGRIDATLDNNPLLTNKTLPPTSSKTSPQQHTSKDPKLSLSNDFTVHTTFKTGTNPSGSLFSKCLPGDAEWTPDAKALFIRSNRLVYDIGWLGDLSGGPKLKANTSYQTTLIVHNGTAHLFLNGKQIATKKEFTRPDKPNFIFKIAHAAPNFGKDLKDTSISNLQFWNRALEGPERTDLLAGKLDSLNTPDLNWSPTTNPETPTPTPTETFNGMGQTGIPTTLKLTANPDFKIKSAWTQPLEPTPHANLITNWNEQSYQEGRKLYNQLCITCHGDTEKEGSLPTAPRFHKSEFKNGTDPYRLYQTLTKGYGLMVAQPQYTPAQKYALIHYIRKAFLEQHNTDQLFPIDKPYLTSLPKGLQTIEPPKPSTASSKPYEAMNFGPALMWTYQVNEPTSRDPLDWNIAQKGINIRLDAGPGGVSKGKAWAVYDHDTLRLAALYSGDFVNWKGIAFDGSHGTHTSITGQRLLITPDQPAWQNPTTGDWTDARVVGRDTRKFGPLPRTWVHYKGLYYHGEDIPVLHYTVGDATILERPGWIEYGTQSLFTRTLNISKSKHPLITRLAPTDSNLTIIQSNPKTSLKKADHFWTLTIPAEATPLNLTIGYTQSDEASAQSLLPPPADLTPLTTGGPARFKDQTITVAGQPGNNTDPFAVDTIPVPNKTDNPWNAWMRLGGFDFFPDNPDRAAVCTWLGDVWLVDGISGDLSQVTWRRICTGLFQPLGLKIVHGKIYVTCRDQIARLHDLNGDLEIDYVENFNNDAQVTEHFHEFAMGLQTDKAGNFYYAKSARHAKTAVVPHHGTLLRVSPDGTKTDIVATGFRAANGVCLNPDGTWIVTDQEGHWNPKNRINYVREGGFYGNMFGYHDVTDESDNAMQQPLCWITNSFDRSPSELIWVPEDANWGKLNGTLLNLSYGYGMVYTVPHEILPDGQAQGGMSPFPIENLPTGTHRGRFHPVNKQLYTVGMFAWAGSQKADGGFYRIRATGKPAWMPTRLQVKPDTLTVSFSDELPENNTAEITAWDLQRTARYGSKHFNERELKITQTKTNGHSLTLTIPGLKPTWGMEIRIELGNGTERIIHNSIHRIPGAK